MELRVLRYVIALADERHFGRAADRCLVAQSALSHQVKQLETELDVRLFDRTTRQVSITQAGTRFLDHARRIVIAADRASADMRATAGGRIGAVTVGFVGTATYDVLPRVTQHVRTELPDVELTLRGELLNPVLLDGVRTGELDLALVRTGSSPTDGLEVQHLRDEPLVAVLPDWHPLASSSEIELNALRGDTFVFHPSGERSSMHEHVLAACRANGFQPRGRVEVSETSTLVVFVAAGLGVALVPAPVRSLRLDGVRYVDLVDPPAVALGLVSQATVGSAAATRVSDVIRRCISSQQM